MERIVDIDTDGQHLSVFRGFLKVERDRQEVGRVPLDDIAAVVVHGHGTTYSNNLVVALAERNALLVACSPNHMPAAMVWPISGHHLQGARMRAQWQASKPLQKQLWRQIVKAKILMQAAVLRSFGTNDSALNFLADRVRSGDAGNVEAQAARRYWPLLMGPDFRRDRNAQDRNALLNYGYTVLRACTARAVVGAGLHPTIGLAHANRSNEFALADDLMEPFRPLIDMRVRELGDTGQTEVSGETKSALVRMMAFDLQTLHGSSPVFSCLQRLSGSLATAFESGQGELDLPRVRHQAELAPVEKAHS